jgi:hypothetical protein
MSEYKGIKGFQVQTRTEDPVPYAQALADNPYAGVWSAGGNVNSARFLFDSGVGSLTAGLIAGNSPSPNAEQYNGTSWTNITSLGNNTAGRAGAGTSTAALEFGGTPGLGVTEYWNGSSWTELNDLNTGRNVAGGIGTAYTAALCAGGDAPGYVANVESWNGSTWTEVNDLNTARGHAVGVGTQTNGILVGSAPPLALTETWNGSSWTETTDLNTGRYGLAGSGASSTDALVFGGESPAPGFFANTESWDGSSWTEVNDMATGRYYLAGAGTSSSAWAASGETTTSSSATEEWTFSGLDPSTTPAADYANAITGDFYYNSTSGQFKAVNTGGAPIGTWASGGAMNSAKRLQGGSGSSNTAALVFGGRQIPGTNVAETESYDGTSFTEVADLSRTNERAYIAGAGTQTAALAIGGAPPGVLGLTEQWNGSAWTEVADLNRGPAGPQSTAYGAGSGSSTSALYSSSDEAGNVNNRVESWDGSSWTEVSEVNTARSYGTQAGTDNTSAIFAGGYTTTNVANVETWDGSSWSEITDINTARMRLSSGMQGSTESMLIFSGYTTDSVANTEDWNGSTWTEVNDMATARRSGTGSGVSTSAFQAGGQTGPSAPTVVANNEEFTANDFLIKTVTTS